MEELRGAPVARALLEKITPEISRLAGIGIVPKLAVVRVGEREDDLSYERSIIKRFSTAGAEAEVLNFDETISQAELEAAVKKRRQTEVFTGYSFSALFRSILTPRGFESSFRRKRMQMA